MAKKFKFDRTRKIERLSRSEQEDLLFDLLSAFQVIKDPEEIALFVQDIFTRAEAKRLAKRLRIAKLLLDGMKYEEIEEEVHTSHVTIAKVAAWLAERGDGFRQVLEKLPKRRAEKTWAQLSDWDRYKRRHAMYFWPELLLQEILRNASKKEKLRLQRTLASLDRKSKLHKDIEKLLRR